MALISPGVQVSVIDQSNYTPAAASSVPYILLVTAQNKISGAGTGVAPGTLAVNANKLYLMTSQRDLLSTFGVPFFYNTTAGTPINGYELNEYGLLAAYSALGVTNIAYVQRADIDLAALTATLTRPFGAPANGTYWLDTTNSTWGINEWNQTTSAFTHKTATVITDTVYLEPSSTVPMPSFGSIGNYAVTATNVYNPTYYKRGGPTTAQAPGWLQDGASADDLYNTWVLIGSDYWKTSWPTVQGTLAPTSLAAGVIDINGTMISVTSGETVTQLVTAINNLSGSSLPGVYAANIGGKLSLYADSGATNDDSTEGQGVIAISGTPLAALGITSGQYAAPAYVAGPNYSAPRWRTTDTQPEPTGSVFQQTNSVNQGMLIEVKKFNSTLGTFVLQSCPVYVDDAAALYAIDPSTGGQAIPAGTTYAQIDPLDSMTSGLLILERQAPGATVITGSATNPTFTVKDLTVTGASGTGSLATLTFATQGSAPFANGTTIEVAGLTSTGAVYNGTHTVTSCTTTQVTFASTATGAYVSGGSITQYSTFTLTATQPETATVATPVTVTINGTTSADFIAAVSAAGINNVSATVNSAGAIVFTHATGGDIYLVDGTDTPLVDAGFSTAVTGIRYNYVGGMVEGLILSNWVGSPTFTYTSAASAPEIDPANGTLWYYSDATTADIMIQNNGEWMGYQNVTNDVRGYDLSMTNPDGPIFSATAPTTQTDAAESPLAYGDLWINTADLENYPVISRWQSVSGQDQWVQISNADQTTINGILFADARWAPNGTTNPITDPIPPIATGSTPLITSDYLDLDAPNPLLYPEGMLLWNTRRSGFNVKSFAVDYFNATDYPAPDVLPSQTNTWVTASGNRADGSPNMGRHAQRYLIVKALKAGIDTNTQIRENQAQFNLIVCPQYPELAPNMRVLNNDRGDTAFSVVDTPLRLTPEDVVAWSTNNSGLGQPFGDGNLDAGDAYAAAFYPSCTTTDLTGNTVVTAPSHMMLRTIIRSDSVAYPWFAPAGLRRGVVDNALQIGYLMAQTGEFQPLGVNQGLRDVLYSNDVNPITFIPGTGITNFGNHTLQGTATALDRINVARLVAFIRGRLEIIGNQYLFEPNDTITRAAITAQITALMIDLVNKRGLYDYLVVCDLTNNTPATIDANELYVDIAIEPVKAVEFIYIPMRIQNTGTIQAQASA